MNPWFLRLLLAVVILSAAVLAVGAWRRHGNADLARLAADARAGLRDALRAEAQIIRRHVYEPWPYWWGTPDYERWEERRTFFVAPADPPSPEPRPVLSSQVHAGVVAAPSQQSVSSGRVGAAPLQRIRRRASPL